jgi:hypothetical protein
MSPKLRPDEETLPRRPWAEQEERLLPEKGRELEDSVVAHILNI